MTVVESTINGVTVLAPLGGRLDAAGCGEFRRRLEEILERGQTLVVCDLSSVPFMDSTGLGVLLGALRSLAGRGRLACSGAVPAVRKLFEITRLDQGLMGVYDTVEGAVEALSGIDSREGRP